MPTRAGALARTLARASRTLCTRGNSSATEGVFVAVGSNLGDRGTNIHTALQRLRAHAAVSVTDTSRLYETAAMYEEAQPPFLNGVVRLETSLEPRALLRALKAIERAHGRDMGAARNSARCVDLDIVAYGSRQVRADDGDLPLEVPHPRAAEREFVLRPLCDIDPTVRLPSTLPGGPALPALELLDKLPKSGMPHVTPLPGGKVLRWGQRTLLMGVLNTTPDSFSDGGVHNSVDAALQTAELFARQGFDVLDVGGQSTRPGAQPVGTEEELRRVMPVLSALHETFPDMAISIDTFDAGVAERAVQAGAAIVNDVSAGRRDAHMFDTVGGSGAAYIAMHSRGTPADMTQHTRYSGSGIDRGAARADSEAMLGVAATELGVAVDAAVAAGVARWSVLVDGGVGFAKTPAQSRAVVAHGRRFSRALRDAPVLLGASRKRWMRELLHGPDDADAATRDWGTAGGVAASIALGGADMVRVHEPRLGDVVRVADAVVAAYRDGGEEV